MILELCPELPSSITFLLLIIFITAILFIYLFHLGKVEGKFPVLHSSKLPSLRYVIQNTSGHLEGILRNKRKRREEK